MTRLALPALVLVAVTVPSCEKVPLLAPSLTLLELTASTATLGLNGSAEITAMLTEGLSAGLRGGGSPVQNGTVVSFTTTLGRLEPSETTTTNGRATVRLLADGRSGTAVIKAFSGPAASAEGTTASLEMPIGAAAAAAITITASPQSLTFPGGTSTVSARVEDDLGNSLGGVPVNFGASAGTLSAASALSNTQGLATTTLSTTQESTVTANAGGLSKTITITIKPRAIVAITSPTSIIVGVPATFQFAPGASSAALTSVDVDFGDGEGASLGAIAAATSVAHVYRSSGVKTVSADARAADGSTGSSSTQVVVSPLTVTLAASPSSPVVGAIVTFTATVATGAIIERYEWNFGDGNAVATSNNQVTTSYARVGAYVASVRAIPLGGGTPATALATVDVKP